MNNAKQTVLVLMAVGGLMCGSVDEVWGDEPSVTATPPPSDQRADVRGKVTFRHNGKPVGGATIVVAKTGLAAISDEDGSFVIKSVPVGNRQIDVIMYRDVVASKVVRVEAGTPIKLQLAIPKVEFAGEVIVVTGTRTPEKVFDAPISIEAVSDEDIQRAAGPSYLSALADTKGVDFANAGVLEQRISTRGFNTQFNSRMLSMVDGRLARLPGSGLAQGIMVPSTSLDMKSVEVVLGPASALYGADAHAGVINVVTKSPWDESGVSAALRGGTQELFDGSLRLAGTVADKFGWKLNAQFLRATDFSPDRNAQTHYFNSDVFEADLVDAYDVGTTKLEGSAYYRVGEWTSKVSYGFSETDSFSLTNAGRNHVRDWRVQYQSAQISHPNWYAQVTRTTTGAGKTYQLDRLAGIASMMQADGQDISPTSLDAVRDSLAFVDRSQLLDSEVQHRRVFAKVQATVGAQYRVFLPDSAGTYLADADDTIEAVQLGAYAQLDRRFLANRLRVILAGRVDNHTNYSNQFSPKAGVVYEVARNHKIRASYNRAFKSPTILENFLLINGVLLGNRNGFSIRDSNGAVVQEIAGLEPETVNSVELGYKGAIGSKLYVDAVAYHSWHKNFISPLSMVANPNDATMPTFAFDHEGNQVADGTLFTYLNFGSARVRGADLGVNVYPIEGITFTAGGSWIDLAQFSNESGQSDLLLNVPTFKLKSSITIKDLGMKNWFTKVSARWNNAYEFESGYWSASRFFNDGKIPSRLVLNLSAGYEFKKLGVGVRGFVMNALGDDRIDVLGAPMPKRMVFVQLSYRGANLNY